MQYIFFTNNQKPFGVYVNRVDEMKKYATMTSSAAIVVFAKTKKEAALKLNVNIKNVYLY